MVIRSNSGRFPELTTDPVRLLLDALEIPSVSELNRAIQEWRAMRVLVGSLAVYGEDSHLPAVVGKAREFLPETDWAARATP